MRRSESGKSWGQNKGPKGENSAESKTSRKKKLAAGKVSSKFLPVYFVDPTHPEVPKELEVQFHSIQEQSGRIKMRDKDQIIAIKRGSSAEKTGLSLKPDKLTFDPDLQIAVDASSASVGLLKQLNAPVLGVCSDQDLKVAKLKSKKKSSKRAREDHARSDRNQSLETISEIETVSPTRTLSKDKRKWSSSKLVPEMKNNEDLSVDIGEEPNKKEKESLFLEKEKRRLSGSGKTPKADTSEIYQHHSKDLSDNGSVKMTPVQGKEKSIFNATSSTVINTSTVKTTSKNKNEIFPDLALSPEMSALKSSRLPFVTGGFASHSKRKHISSSSPKSLDYSMEAESSLNLSSEKSLGASFNSSPSKINLNNSFMSDRSVNSSDSISSQTFLCNSSFLETPKTPESINSAEILRWKQSRGMSDIGPRSNQNLAWRDSVRSSPVSLHASLLDTPPYARHRERLLDKRHLFPKRYPHASVEKYQSFQHRSHLAAQRSDWKSIFMNQCWSLQNSFIDSHCHLDFLFDRLLFDGSFQKYYRKNLDTFPSNFAGCVAVFCEPKSFTSEGLWKTLISDDMVWLAMGCHPKKATGFDAAAEKGLAECLKYPKVAAVGEIGLDYSGGFFESAKIQKRVFICQIKMALAIKKPLVIHCRDAQKDCLQILKKYVPSDYRIHCHCFTKSFDLATEWLSFFPNLYIGLTPLVTYPSAKEVHDTARKLPLERLLLETDAPYFVPKLVPRGTMKFSHPGMAISVAFEVAKLKGIDVETVLQHCLRNTKQMYGI